MRRYDILVFIPSSGRYEIIKDNQTPSGFQEEDYWNECFSWQELKVIVPHMRFFKWRLSISPIDEEDLAGKIHLFPFTYGVNHEVQMIKISGIKLIMARDMGRINSPKHSFHPFRY